MMSTQQPPFEDPWRNHPWRGMHMFAENRNTFPAEELLKYLGKYVAWYPDGSHIFDSDPDYQTLLARVEASGDDPIWYRIEYIGDEGQI
jgi:hypothetical protein